MKARIGVMLALVLAFLAVGMLLAQPNVPQLVNPGFEGEFTVRDNAPEVEVAVGWDPAWIQGDDRECRVPCYRPEFKPERTIKVQGETSQRWFTTFARQFAAVYQRVAVEAGQWYEFSCDVYAISEPNGQMGAFVGINPWGGAVFHRTMVWGQEQVDDQGWIYRRWTRVSVTAQAWSDTITVAAAGNNAWATKNNAVYWDNCALRRVDAGTQPTPSPCPTCEPGQGCDYGTIRGIIHEELKEREPIKWPR